MPQLIWKKYIQRQLSANPQFLVFLWVSGLQSACPLHPQQREAFQPIHALHSLPSPPLKAFAHLSVCSVTTVLRVYSVSPSSLLPSSILLSHALWSIWTLREKGDLSVKASSRKWRLRWRRHALYIKCSDPCEGRRRIQAGDISIGFC